MKKKNKFTKPDEDRAFWLLVRVYVVHNPDASTSRFQVVLIYIFFVCFPLSILILVHTNLHKYLTYPEVMLDVVDYLRREIARLDKVSDESIINIGVWSSESEVVKKYMMSFI